MVLALLGGSVKTTGPDVGAAEAPRDGKGLLSPAIKDRLNQTEQLFFAGEYARAAAAAESGRRDAMAAGQIRVAVQFLNDIGNCRLALLDYPSALESFLQARRLSEAAGNLAVLPLLDSNLSALYLKMDQVDEAAQVAERSRKYAELKQNLPYRAKLLHQLATIRARQGRMDLAAALFREAIDAAWSRDDPATAASAWDALGNEYLRRGDTARAEPALTESFRVRKLHQLRNLDASYLHLGLLRLAQHDLRSAETLLDEAVRRQAHPDSLVSVWLMRHALGRVRLAQGRLAESVEDLAAAVDLARRWRLDIVPADASRVRSDAGLREIYGSFIDGGSRLYFSGGSRSWVRSTFAAAEENRAASLRALVFGEDWRRSLPAEYWDTLSKLKGAELRLFQDDSQPNRTRTASLDLALTQMEAHASFGRREAVMDRGIRTSTLADRAQRRLAADCVLFSFHLGETDSLLWAVTRNRMEVYRLPGRAELLADGSRFSEAVRDDAPRAVALGAALYSKLFGRVAAAFTGKRRWMLSLDGPLFGLPFAALVDGGPGATPVYLAQLHPIQITPGALMMDGKPGSPLSGTFVGVGDAIYNTADPRWSGRQALAVSPISRTGLWAAAPESGIRLARLPVSHREIAACARAWDPAGKSSILLEGSRASIRELRETLRAEPGIVHLATHVIDSPRGPHQLIALSLSGRGEPDMLSPVDIKALSTRAGLVALSGCSSGRGDAVPGEGLVRAWLAAGAGAVAATHWPGPDDGGALFERLYRHLRERPQDGPAAALRRAQLDMLHSGTWRSRPRYWAGYFVAAG